LSSYLLGMSVDFRQFAGNRMADGGISSSCVAGVSVGIRAKLCGLAVGATAAAHRPQVAVPGQRGRGF
jgi:hypothetical protein